ncbi:hypothetical protein POTOM_035270 [Populus tomentosa]|uniref:Uncharacterized protein n=1 Tax=Populus tomentosa TaxID=118781 RepID=A0A8X8CLU9_POPTO|nr:hypothetical protein POTOM_035270 [Populus tomentosa]
MRFRDNSACCSRTDIAWDFNMARQADRLAKIGQEGFAAIDEHFGRAKRRPPVMKVPYAHPTYYYVHQANQIPATKLIDSNEAAQRYNDYPKGKPVPF